jgi:transposase
LKGEPVAMTHKPPNYAIGLIAAISHERVEGYVLRNGTTNKLVIANFIIDLAIKLRNRQPPITVPVILYLDNASYHCTNDIRDLIELLIGSYIFAPSYSSFSNPIESLFSWLKGALR